VNFIEAAKISNYIRRKGLAKHSGSSGNGWINARFAFEQGRNTPLATGYEMQRLLSWEDLMADDWEAKEAE
jgi:hypothetical protein